MAKVKSEVVAKDIELQEEIKEKKVEQKVPEVSTQDLLAIIAQLKGEIENLKSTNNTPVSNPSEDLIRSLAENKTNREVVIVHNRQMMGKNLSTLIKLDNYRTKLRDLGEERVLTYQQFEQFISKYPAYIEKDIVLLHPKHQDLAEKFHMRCYDKGSEEYLTQTLLRELSYASVARIEEIYLSLNQESRNSLLSFWLGKCYEKDKNFYDRYKLDLLKRLSESKIFDVMIHEINQAK